MGVAGLGDRPLNARRPRGMLAGHQTDEGTDGAAGEPVPVADLDRECEPGQGADPTQTSESVHHVGELRVARHLADRGVEPIPTSFDRQDVLVVGVEGQPGRTAVQLRERLVSQPGVVLPGPRLAAVVDDPVTQQQLRHPVPGPHQVAAAVLTGTDQVAGGLLVHSGDRHRGDLVESQQPGQVDRVLGVGLDPIPGRLLQLRRRRDHASDPRHTQVSLKTETGRAGLVGHRHRTRQPLDPGPDVLVGRGQLRLDQLARDAIDRRRRDRSCVHVEPNARTLGKHRGLPQLLDRPSRPALLGNPRPFVSGAPAYNPQQP